MQAEAVRTAVMALHAAYEDLAACGIDTLTRDELLAATDDLEILDRQLPTQRHRMLAQLQSQATPGELGAKSWREVLMVRWRLSSTEAHRRLADAAVLGPRRALSGEPMAPVLAATAAAQALGLITTEHVEVIGKGMAKLPRVLDPATRDQIEVEWVRHAVGTGPKVLADTVARRLFLLDQDGPAPDDAERARRRGVSKGPQQPDGSIHLNAELTPAAWAIWEALFAKFAAPGMCNPADELPATSGTPTQDQIDTDTRTPAQRRHDALAFIGRTALDKAELGQHNGLPTTIIVRTTLQDLESRAGVGLSGGGTVLPLTDVLQLAADTNTHHYLAVFDGATGSALNLFRARRTASVAQRIALIARDGGCTKPGCTVPAYGTQAHHAARDWTNGGLTNIDDLGLACGPDNRMVGTDGWTTRINEIHDVEWIPPQHLDTGQARINHYHRPEELHPPPSDAWMPPREADGGPVGKVPLVPDDWWAAFGEAAVFNDPAATDEPATNGEPRANGGPAANDGPVRKGPLAPDDWWAAFGDAAVFNDPAATRDPATNGESWANDGPATSDEPAANGDNTTRQSGDPDPPDGKAA